MRLFLQFIVLLDSREETALTSLAPVGPALQRFYVFKKDEIPTTGPMPTSTESPLATVNPASLESSDLIDEDEAFKLLQFDEDDGPIEIINQVIIASLWYWWKEVLGISLLTAVLLNILLMKPLMRAVRMQTIRDMLRYFRNWKNPEHQVVFDCLFLTHLLNFLTLILFCYLFLGRNGTCTMSK